MKNKIQRWSKLDSKQQIQPYDFGGWLKQNAGSIGSVLGAGIGTMIAPGVGTSIGASIGGQVGGMAGTIGDGKSNMAQINEQRRMQTQDMLNSMPKSGQGMAQGSMLAYGGYLTPSLLAKSGIYIKPENRGKFTATKERTGKSTEELTHSKNPLTRKRAVFAQNARKWSHAEGGYANPLSMPNNSVYNYQGGGTHNQNPLGGIPIGKSIQGKQNTVEQGESSFTFPEGKYIFSNRLKLK